MVLFPIYASGENFYPQNTTCMAAVKILTFLELGKNPSFMDSNQEVDLSELHVQSLRFQC